MSFIEFLCAIHQKPLAQELVNADPKHPLHQSIHDLIDRYLGEFMGIGGMPEAVSCWAETQDPILCQDIHHDLVDNYRQDFHKYAQRYQIKYLERLFSQIPKQVGRKFKYSAIEGDLRKRDLAPCLDLMLTAGITHRISHSAGNGVPLGAEANPNKFKLLFLDIALMNTILGINLKTWFLKPQNALVNKREFVEAFIGQELLAYSNPQSHNELYYWHREARSSHAEVDYLCQTEEGAIPIAVKNNDRRSLKNLRLFLDLKPQSPYGIRFSLHNFSSFDKIASYPLYAVAKISDQVKAIQQLIS